MFFVIYTQHAPAPFVTFYALIVSECAVVLLLVHYPVYGVDWGLCMINLDSIYKTIIRMYFKNIVYFSKVTNVSRMKQDSLLVACQSEGLLCVC